MAGNTFVTLTHGSSIQYIYPISSNNLASFFGPSLLPNVPPVKQIFTLMGCKTVCYPRLRKRGLTFILMEHIYNWLVFCSKDVISFSLLLHKGRGKGSKRQRQHLEEWFSKKRCGQRKICIQYCTNVLLCNVIFKVLYRSLVREKKKFKNVESQSALSKKLTRTSFGGLSQDTFVSSIVIMTSL